MPTSQLPGTTKALSKKIQNHADAVALQFMYYNFCRIHETIRMTPAMGVGVTDRLWEIGDIVDLIDAVGPKLAQ